MSKTFFISLTIHTIIIAIFFNLFSIKEKRENKHKTKIISLKHIVLKQEPKKQIKKEIKKTPPKKPPIKKQKPKKFIKKKKIVKKRKIIKKKKIIQKPPKKRKNTPKPIHKKEKTSPSPTAASLQKEIKQPILTSPTNKTELKEKNYIKLNISKIYEAIEKAKKYPKIAKRLKIQGEVSVSFTILPNGEVTNIKTSGAHKILQKSAYKTIKEASVEFPKPNEKVNIQLKIKYILK